MSNCNIYVNNGASASAKNEIGQNLSLASFMLGEWKEQIFNHWNPITQRTVTLYMTKWLLPSFGDYALASIGYDKVNEWFYNMRISAKIGANRALDILKSVFTLALKLGYCQDDPCRFIERNSKKQFNRFLSCSELKNIGESLARLESENASYYQQANIVRMLLLTGCQVSEILNLKWTMIKPNSIDLLTSKRGVKTVYLNENINTILLLQPKINLWVFPAPRTNKPYTSIFSFWKKVRSLANVPDVCIHDLRHTFISYATLQGDNVPMIAKMLLKKRFPLKLKSSIQLLIIRFTDKELVQLNHIKQGNSLESWICEVLKQGVILDKMLNKRERLYRVRAKFEHYKQKEYRNQVVLMLTPEEFAYFSDAAKNSNLRLSSWSRVKALDKLVLS